MALPTAHHAVSKPRAPSDRIRKSPHIKNEPREKAEANPPEMNVAVLPDPVATARGRDTAFQEVDSRAWAAWQLGP
jgi:hypothetical protein